MSLFRYGSIFFLFLSFVFLPAAHSDAIVSGSDSSILSQQKYPPLTKAEKDAFYKQMNQALKRQFDRVQQIITQQGNGNVWAPDNRARLEHAKGMLEVKQTLVGNFVETPSIRSPEIREKLLQILNKEDITVIDLSELKLLVSEIKPQILSEDRQNLIEQRMEN